MFFGFSRNKTVLDKAVCLVLISAVCVVTDGIHLFNHVTHQVCLTKWSESLSPLRF